MSSILRIFSPVILLGGLILILGCGEEKNTQPAVNHAPDAPSNPVPVSEATSIDTNIVFSWHCSDPDGDTVKYDVYFDTLSSPVLATSNQLDSTYQASLEVSRDYYWKVVARDEHGSETASPVWHFSTVVGSEQIVFISYRNGFSSIYSMNPNGSNVHIISDTLNANENWPSISNDGAKIAFAQGASQIYTMNLDGTVRFQVTHLSGGGPSLPVWSPDGSQIAFVVQGGNEVYYSSIWVVDANGENPHAVANFLMPNYECEEISWSPHGEGFAFEYDSLGARSCAIYAINSDGTNMRALTDHSNYDIDPAWSHDGTKIAFIRRLGDPELYQVFVMNSDGSDQHNVQNTQVYGFSPCWSPDDSQIAYVSYANEEDDCKILIMNADGSNRHNITTNGAIDRFPSWGPYHR